MRAVPTGLEGVRRRRRLTRALVFAWLLVAGVPAAADGAVAFMYHRFGEDRFPATSIRVEQFEDQLDMLTSGGFQVVPLRDVLAFVDEGKPLPPRAVAITIDDAYLSVYETAWPRLRERGLPFTVFVSTGPVDAGYSGYMNWDQMREMASAGVSFANHGAGHLYMVQREEGETADTWAKRITDDIVHAQRRLDYELSAMMAVLPQAFAYPYGEYDAAVAGIVRDLGYIAFGQQSGAIGATSDRRALPRFPMAEGFAALGEFRTKALSLSLPVTGLEPWDPVTGRRPELAVVLGASEARLEELACYVSGQGRVNLEWIEPGKRFRVGPERPLGRGRARVNCTAPGPQGRYFWFGHQWIVQ